MASRSWRWVNGAFRGGVAPASSVVDMAQTIPRRGPVSGTAVDQGGKRKPFLLDFYSTAVGKKYVMAITGIIGIGFVIGHMIGNLKAYLGVIDHEGGRAYDIDVYGEYLRELLVPILPHGYFLWIMRLVLIGLLGRAVGGWKVGTVAAWIAAVYPHFVV